MDRATFEAVVHEAVASIPEVLRAQLANVDVVVEAWPSDDDLRMADVQEGYALFGLYTGVPLTERTSDYNMVLPDKITIYQGPLQDAFGEPEHWSSTESTVIQNQVFAFKPGWDYRLEGALPPNRHPTLNKDSRAFVLPVRSAR